MVSIMSFTTQQWNSLDVQHKHLIHSLLVVAHVIDTQPGVRSRLKSLTRRASSAVSSPSSLQGPTHATTEAIQKTLHTMAKPQKAGPCGKTSSCLARERTVGRTVLPCSRRRSTVTEPHGNDRSKTMDVDADAPTKTSTATTENCVGPSSSVMTPQRSSTLRSRTQRECTPLLPKLCGLIDSKNIRLSQPSPHEVPLRLQLLQRRLHMSVQKACVAGKTTCTQGDKCMLSPSCAAGGDNRMDLS